MFECFSDLITLASRFEPLIHEVQGCLASFEPALKNPTFLRSDSENGDEEFILSEIQRCTDSPLDEDQSQRL